MHDTMYVFQAFYFFYNDYFFHGEFPQWMPFGFFGMQSNSFFIGMLSPSNYLVGLIGYIFKVRNVLLLFKASLFLEQFVFLFGMYLLSKYLFKHKTTVIFVSIAAVCSQFLLWQLWFNFRMFSHMPLIIYFMVRCFSEYKPQYLIMAMCVFIVSLLGLEYQAPVLFLCVSIVFLVLLVGKSTKLFEFLHLTGRDIKLSVLYLVAFLVLSATYYFYMQNILEYQTSLATGRNPLTKQVEMESFLSYGRDIGLEKFINLLLPNKLMASDNSLFVGITTLVFAIYGIMRARKLVLTAFCLIVVVFGLLSVGDKTPVASFLYEYFPLMKYYRHIGSVTDNYKLFLPLIAGFGVDYFIDRINKSKDFAKSVTALRIIGSVVLLSAAVAAAFLVINCSESRDYLSIGEEKLFMSEGTRCDMKIYDSFAAVGGLSFLVFLSKSGRRRNKALLTFCILLEMVVYQGLIYKRFYPIAEKAKPMTDETVMVSKYGFPERRLMSSPWDRRTQETKRVVDNTEATQYSIAYDYMQWDPCGTSLKSNFIGRNIKTLMHMKNAIFSFDIGSVQWFLPYYFSSIGCESPKLRLIANAIFVNNVEEAAMAVAHTKNLDETLILNDVPRWLVYNPEPSRVEPGEAEEIRIKSYRPNELELEVNSPAGMRWLYYADSWHPSWKAYVNDVQSHVVQANVAFKAVRLNGGLSRVRFVFDDRTSWIGGGIIFICGISFMFILLTSACIRLFGLPRTVNVADSFQH